MNSERKFDEGGQLAASGKKNDIILGDPGTRSL